TILYTEKQFRDITRAPEWSTGFYDGRIKIPAAGASLKPALFERVLKHELTHAFVAGIAPRGVPAWLHEGLAQLFEGADVDEARRRMRIGGRVVPLAMLAQLFSVLGAADAQVAYDESLLAVSHLSARGGFNWSPLLRDLGAGRSFEDAIAGVGLSYADLE